MSSPYPTLNNNAKTVIIVVQHDKKYTILMCACPGAAAVSQAQIRQESRLTSVDLNLKNGVFPSWNKIRSDVHSCSFHALYEKIGSCATLTEAIQWSVIKEPQNNVYCWISIKMTKFESWKSWDLVSYKK